MFNENVANLLQQERLLRDYDMDAIYIVKAAEIVICDMFQGIFSFNSPVPETCCSKTIKSFSRYGTAGP